MFQVSPHLKTNPYYDSLIQDGDFLGVQHAHFKKKKGCKVNIYKKSHLSKNFSS